MAKRKIWVSLHLDYDQRDPEKEDIDKLADKVLDLGIEKVEAHYGMGMVSFFMEFDTPPSRGNLIWINDTPFRIREINHHPKAGGKCKTNIYANLD